VKGERQGQHYAIVLDSGFAIRPKSDGVDPRTET
jgi:hypothetical protein